MPEINPKAYITLSADRLRVAKNFGSLLLLRGLDFLLPLLTVPYLLRTIGVENYGLIGFGYAFALYSAAVIQYGFGTTATREIARNRHDIHAIREIYSSVAYSTLILGVVVLLISVAAVILTPTLRQHWVLMAVSLIQSTATSLFPIWLFQGIERMGYIAYLHAIAKIIVLAGIFSIIREPSDYLYVPVINALGSIAILVGGVYLAAKRLNIFPQAPDISAIKSTLKKGRHAFTSQLAPTLYNNSTTFLLGFFAGGYVAGVYSAATKVIEAICSLAYIVSNAYFPQLSRSLEIHNKFKQIMISVGVAGTLMVVVAAKTIGEFLHPIDGPIIASTLQLMSAGIFFLFAILTFGTNYLMVTGQDRVSAKITLYTSSIFFVIAIILIPSYGLHGAIATVVCARGTMAAAFYLAYRNTKV